MDWVELMLKEATFRKDGEVVLEMDEGDGGGADGLAFCTLCTMVGTTGGGAAGAGAGLGPAKMVGKSNC